MPFTPYPKPEKKKKKKYRGPRKYSPKRARKEESYRKAHQHLAEQTKFCAGCGCNGCRIMPSHRVPRSVSFDLIDDPDNLDALCLKCSEKVELGLWMELPNRQLAGEIDQYISESSPKYYRIKKHKDGH